MTVDELLAWLFPRAGSVRACRVEDQLELFSDKPTAMFKVVDMANKIELPVFVREAVFVRFLQGLPPEKRPRLATRRRASTRPR